MSEIISETLYAIIDNEDVLYRWTLHSTRQRAIYEFVSSPYGSTKWMQIDGTLRTAWKQARKEGYRTEKITLTWKRTTPGAPAR